MSSVLSLNVLRKYSPQVFPSAFIAPVWNISFLYQKIYLILQVTPTLIYRISVDSVAPTHSISRPKPIT